MKIGVIKESRAGENRVALVPSLISLLLRDKHSVYIETGAGEIAQASDEAFKKAGAIICEDANKVFSTADVYAKIIPPSIEEANKMPEGSFFLGFLNPTANPGIIEVFLRRRITSFAFEYVPRITRAQSMDALSSMATIAGYKSVLLGAEYLGKMFPLLMTAAGTIPPANVLILGVGVAGLQAIATAKRLGAKVEAYDVRTAAKEQVQSLGASFIEIETDEDMETKGGYAKEQSKDFLHRQREVLSKHLEKVHLVITTAQVFGRCAPVLITQEMVKVMPYGSVIVDLAAEQGGNCELTECGKVVRNSGVIILGAENVPALVPTDASLLYGRNVINFVKLLFPVTREGVQAMPDFADEVIASACITKDGEIINESVKLALMG